MAMDIPRDESVIRAKKRRRVIYAALGLAALGLITVGLSRLEPAAPSVDRATVWMDTVKRGEMLRQVRGPGTLVPEEIRWIAASTEGRVERVIVKPGTRVEAATVLLEMSSPEREQALLEAEAQLRAAEADYENLKAELQSALLNEQGQVAAAESDYLQAALQAEANTELNKEGLVSDLTEKISALRAEQLKKLHQVAESRLVQRSQAVEAQLNAQVARLRQAQTLYNLRKEQAQALQVVAGISGVLQQMDVEVGQRVIPGTNLAKVAQPEKLKAELRIPETQAKDVQVGQLARIDTRNGIVDGSVIRIDPAVQNGTVTVDVALEGDLPKGARPDLSVDGTIQIERLEDVLYVGRPAYGQANSTIGLFRLEPDGETARRAQVRLGRSSVNTIEIVEGLAEGDRVILSDTSQWDGFDRIRLD